MELWEIQREQYEFELNSLWFHENRCQDGTETINNLTGVVTVPDTFLLGLLNKLTRKNKYVGNQTFDILVTLKLAVFKLGLGRKVPPLAQV